MTTALCLDRLTISADSSNRAEAQAGAFGIGLVGLGASKAFATASTESEAYLAGIVGDVDNAGARNLTIQASAVDDAIAGAQAAAGGLVAGTKNDSLATVRTNVQAYIGNNSFVHAGENSGDVIRVSATADPEYRAHNTRP